MIGIQPRLEIRIHVVKGVLESDSIMIRSNIFLLLLLLEILL